MTKRQPPIVRAGSGDSHEARLAVLEQRFSDDMQARCSWCNQVASAREGEWVEIIISTPGTGIRPAHVFRCLGCDAVPAEGSGRIVAVPSGARRPGQSPPPIAQPPSEQDRKMPAAAKASVSKTGSAPSGRRTHKQTSKAQRKSERNGATVAGTPRPAPQRRPRPRPNTAPFPGGLSPAP